MVTNCDLTTAPPAARQSEQRPTSLAERKIQPCLRAPSGATLPCHARYRNQREGDRGGDEKDEHPVRVFDFLNLTDPIEADSSMILTPERLGDRVDELGTETRRVENSRRNECDG